MMSYQGDFLPDGGNPSEEEQGWLPGGKPKKKRGDGGRNGAGQKEDQSPVEPSSASLQSGARVSRGGPKRVGSKLDDDMRSIVSGGSVSGAEDGQSKGSEEGREARQKHRPSRCFACGKEGHIRRECPGTQQEKCRGCGQGAHLGHGPDKRLCQKCHTDGPSAKEGAEPLVRADIPCHACGQTGHLSRECQMRNRRKPASFSNAPADHCYECGDSDHIARDCVKPCSNCGGNHRICSCAKTNPFKRCHGCGELGHIQSKCTYPYGRYQVLCWRCKAPGHDETTCPMDRGRDAQRHALGEAPRGKSSEGQDGAAKRPSTAFVKGGAGSSWAAAVTASLWERLTEGQADGVPNEWGEGVQPEEGAMDALMRESGATTIHDIGVYAQHKAEGLEEGTVSTPAVGGVAQLQKSFTQSCADFVNGDDAGIRRHLRETPSVTPAQSPPQQVSSVSSSPSKLLNPNSQDYIPASKISTAMPTLSLADSSAFVLGASTARSDPRTKAATGVERTRSGLSADSPSWQPSPSLAISALKGLTLGGSPVGRSPATRPSAMPSQDVRKAGPEWSVQLPEGFMEAAISPVGGVGGGFDQVEPGRPDADRGPGSGLSRGLAERGPAAVQGSDALWRGSDGALRAAEPASRETDPGMEGSDELDADQRRRVEAMLGIMAEEGEDDDVRLNGQTTVEEPTGWTLTEAKEEGPGRGTETREPPAWREPQSAESSRGRLPQTSKLSLWQAAEPIEATGWSSGPPLGPTGWREMSGADGGASLKVPPQTAVRGSLEQLGEGRGPQLVRPHSSDQQADHMKLPAGRGVRVAPPGFQTLKASGVVGARPPSSERNVVVSHPSETHRDAALQSVGPPGFARANAGGPAAPFSQSSEVETVFATQSHVRTATPGTPPQLVLSRVFVKRTVVDDESTLEERPPLLDGSGAPYPTHVKVDVGRRLPPVEGSEAGGNGHASEMQTWVGRPATSASDFGNSADRPNEFGMVMVEESGALDSVPVNRPVSSSSYAQSRHFGTDGVGSGMAEGPQWEGPSGSGRTQDVRLEGQQEWRKAVGSGRTQLDVTPSPHLQPVVSPHEMLRRFLPQGSDQSAPNSAASTRDFSPPPPLDRPARFSPSHQENGDGSAYSVEHPHWTPSQVPPPPQLYPSRGHTQSIAGLMHHPSNDPTRNPWSSQTHPKQYPQQGPPLSEGYRNQSGQGHHTDTRHVLDNSRAQGDKANQGRLPATESHFQQYSSWQGQGEPPANFARHQTPLLRTLQNDPHLMDLRAKVEKHRMRTEGGNSGAGLHPPATGWNGRSTEELGYQRQSPHVMQNGGVAPQEAGTYSGGYDHRRIQTDDPLPELNGPLGSLLPREKPSPGALQSGQSFSNQEYAQEYAQQLNPYGEPAMPASFYAGASGQHASLPPDPSYGRPSVSPDSAQGMGPGSSRDRKAAYNPMRWQAPQQPEPSKSNQDLVSDADLLRLLEGGLDEPVSEWDQNGDTYGDWRNGVAAAESGGLHGLGELLNGVTPSAIAGGQGGVNTAPRTAAEAVAARDGGQDEDQFEADMKAAMNLSLEEYKTQETTDFLVAQATSWPSLRKTAPPKENVGRGLANKTGEYNCFLNVVIQSLWHLLPFRESVATRLPIKRRMPPEHPATRHLAVLRGLMTIFRALSADEGKPTAVDPSALRTALHNAHAGSDLFQIEEMNDASEVLLSLFSCVHEALQAAHSQPPIPAATVHDGLLPTPALGAPQRNKAGTLFIATDVCSSGCYVHDLFGLDMMEYTECTHCRKRTHELHYQQFFHLVNCSTLSDITVACPGLPFAPLLSRVLHSATPLRPCDKDEGGCGQPTPTTHVLDRPPELFTVALVWANAEASQAQVRSVVNAINTRICVADIFPNLHNQRDHTLRCIVCYYGLHYFAFAFSDKAQQWLLLDDTNVKAVGPWEKVVEQCTNGRLQPSVLFYQAQ